MDVQEVLRFADEMVFAKTGEHFDDLQKSILLGVWEGQKYSQIAETSYCSEGHIRNIASKLWKRLSNVLDEEVTQSNLRSALERRQLFIISENSGNDFFIGNVNVCKDTQASEVPKSRSPSTPTSDTSQPQTRLDLADAPHISSLCDSPDAIARTRAHPNSPPWKNGSSKKIATSQQYQDSAVSAKPHFPSTSLPKLSLTLNTSSGEVWATPHP